MKFSFNNKTFVIIKTSQETLQQSNATQADIEALAARLHTDVDTVFTALTTTKACPLGVQLVDGSEWSNPTLETDDYLWHAEMSANYFWKITKDHFDGDQKGVCGPRNADTDLRENAKRFSLLDADGTVYYEGMIYGDYCGHEPLDDWATQDSGCVDVRIDGEIV